MPHPNCTYLCSIRRIIHSVSDAFCQRLTLFSLMVAATAMAQTQQPIGTVGVQDTTVVGALEIANGRAVLVGNTAINELAGQPLPDYRLLWARYGMRFVPQDMKDLHPLPSGLMGPVILVSSVPVR